MGETDNQTVNNTASYVVLRAMKKSEVFTLHVVLEGIIYILFYKTLIPYNCATCPSEGGFENLGEGGGKRVRFGAIVGLLKDVTLKHT